MPNPIPHAAITFNRETSLYGFSVWMPGKRPHYTMDVFQTPEDARNWIDPQNERIWDDLEPRAAGVVSLSRGYKKGSAPTRC